MNLYDRANMEGPSIVSPDGMCCICRMRPAANRHHIVPRSHGGSDGPTVDVCGFGNASGCHGMLHAHTLHLRYERGRWWALKTGEPTRYDEAVQLPGWWPITEGDDMGLAETVRGNLAARIGGASLSKWAQLHGIHRKKLYSEAMTAKTLCQLADAAGCTTDDLLEGYEGGR